MEDGQAGSTRKANVVGSYIDKSKAKLVELTKKVKKAGRDDPRRIVHSFKVGFALTLVSIFYYVNPLFVGFGVSAMWAVLTVVVVMEYTVGGTLSKGVNRAMATLVAGAMGIGAHHVAALCGEKGEPVVLGIFVFLLAAVATYSRFIPEIKAKYDYGVTVFILTFSLVAISSYRVGELVELAHQRLSTIAVGVAICVFTTVFVQPVWAGEDLHNLVADNLDKLASFLKGMGEEYFEENAGIECVKSISFVLDYKSVLNSKPMEDSLANLARWEPGHGRFVFRHPWKQYLSIGALSRQCACSMEALQNYVTNAHCYHTKVKAADGEPAELCIKIQSSCKNMSTEACNTLTELASAIRTMTVPSAADSHIDAAIAATVKLRAAISEEPAEAPTTALGLAIVASLLADIVQLVHQIAVSTHELARVAHFKSLEVIHMAAVKQFDGAQGTEVVNIVVEE